MDSKNGLSRWIGQHQLISFFLLSFGISWGLLMTLGPLYATGIRRYLRPLVKPQGHLVWYVLALAVVPVLLALSMGITNLLGGELPPPRVVTDGGRGDLQALYSPLTANLILAFFWALWHLPLPQAQGLGNPQDVGAPRCVPAGLRRFRGFRR